MEFNPRNKIILVWLWIGVIMVFAQIILGAITRLTGSGLSITKWDIVTGIFYPSSFEQWNKVFEEYKQTPQYQKINLGMTLDNFKFIFFWEYFHRLWARIMGFVFFIPFVMFSVSKKFSSALFKDLIIVFFLACGVASLGWIMVASGLIYRPWVNAYKLSFHLMAAIILLSYLWWTTLKYQFDEYRLVGIKYARNTSITILTCLLFLQLFLGGVMSGMKAGVVAPTWPDINGSLFPEEIRLGWTDQTNLFGEYEESHINALIIQFLHRSTAYLIYLFVLIVLLYEYFKKNKDKALYYFKIILLLTVQLVLGIVTVLNCVGTVPLWWGTMHQIFGIICFLYVLYVLYQLRVSQE